MNKPILLSIIESPDHPDFSPLYATMGYEHLRAYSSRKAIAAIKKNPPDILVAEFFYGYGNNYAGVNISNLDVTLYSLQKYAARAKIIVLVSKREEPHIDKLTELFDLHALLMQPLSIALMQQVLDDLKK